MHFHTFSILRRPKSRLLSHRSQLAGEPLEERRMMAVLVDDFYPVPATVTDIAMADATRQETDVAYFHPDRVLVDFWGLVNVDAGGANSALNVNNWRLIKDGVDISHLISGIQVAERINNHTDLVVHLSERLGTGNYRIIARDSIHDEFGRPINGDEDTNDSLPGGDADVTLIVADATAEPVTEVFSGSPAATQPVVAADAQGNYVVVWAEMEQRPTDPLTWEQLPPEHALYAQRYSAGGQKLGDAILVAGDLPADDGRQYANLHVAMSSTGAFVVSWTLDARFGRYFFTLGDSAAPLARRFTALGEADGAAFEIGEANSRVESIQLTDAGELVVGYYKWSSPSIWEIDRPTLFPFELVPVELSPPVDFSPIVIPPGIPPTGEFPRFPLLLNSDNELFIRRYSSSGTALGDAIALGAGSDLRLVVNPQGIITAVWDALEADGGGLTVQQFTPQGTARGNKVLIDSLAGTATVPAIASGTGGSIVVAWNQEAAGSHQTYMQRFDANLAFLGQSIVVSQTAYESAARISIAMPAEGAFFIVWDASGGISTSRPNYYGLVLEPTTVDAESGSLRARAFDAAATPLSDEFAFGSTDATAGGASSVVTGPGRLVTAWLDDGGYYNIGDSFYHHRIRPVHVREFTVPVGLVVDLNGNPPGVDIKRDYVPGGSPALLADPAALKIHAESQTIASARITIEGWRAGDALLTYSTNPKIHWSFNAGVLTLSGVDTVANYEALLNDIWFKTTANRAAGSKINVRVVVNDGQSESAPAYSYISIHVPGRSSIAGRHLFYNNSSFDGANAAANAADSSAIATDKAALLPGQTASKANYTGYSRGINGIMVNLAGEHSEITVDDFIFRIGNSNDPSGWAYAPSPSSIVVRPGAGAGGADRVVITWTDGAIRDTWLQVIVLDNGDTGLAAPDIFYFGNRVGDTGNEVNRAQPQSAEALQIMNLIRNSGSGGVEAPVTHPLDIDRSGRINSQDILAMFNAIRGQKGALNMIRAPGGQSGLGGSIITGLEGAIITGGVTLVATIHPELLTATISAAPEAVPQAAVVANWADDRSEDEPLLVSLAPASLMEEPQDD